MIEQDLIDDVVGGNNDLLQSYLAGGGDANALDEDWNCTIIFHAVLGGNLEGAKLLVQHGAKVNAIAGEPGCDILADTALSLAMQCRHLQDFEKFNPIVEFLEVNGATTET